MYKHLTPQEIEEFEKEFVENSVHPQYYKDILSFIDTLIGKRERDLLERYNQFLLKHHYTDADIYAEEPTAIDRFLSPDSPKRNEE